MQDIAQKQIFFYKLPELEPDPDLLVKFPDPDPAKRSGSDRIRIRNTAKQFHKHLEKSTEIIQVDQIIAFTRTLVPFLIISLNTQRSRKLIIFLLLHSHPLITIHSLSWSSPVLPFPYSLPLPSPSPSPLPLPVLSLLVLSLPVLSLPVPSSPVPFHLWPAPPPVPSPFFPCRLPRLSSRSPSAAWSPSSSHRHTRTRPSQPPLANLPPLQSRQLTASLWAGTAGPNLLSKKHSTADSVTPFSISEPGSWSLFCHSLTDTFLLPFCDKSLPPVSRCFPDRYQNPCLLLL
jgi:hypothetical protein